MAVLSLRTAAFRNLADEEIQTPAKDVFLIGENGQGKTNFLEALYFCAYASSFRGVRDGEIARGGSGDFSAAAVLGPLPSAEIPPAPAVFPGRITVKVENSRKSISLDGKKLEDRKDMLEAVPCVAFCHEDMEFVAGSQERRRWFFDQTQSLYDPVYLDDLRRYRKVLKNRNVVLKDAKFGLQAAAEAAELLDVLDPQLAEYGGRLMEKRRKAAARFSAVFCPLYEAVSGINNVMVDYMPSWKSAGNGGADFFEATLGRLGEKRPADLAQGSTLSGPHRDRYLFIRDGSEFSATASTGQRRLLALLLRTAQARCFSEISGKTPVLLLDDVLLELDGEKRRRFLSVMPDYEQAFFTFLPEEPYAKYCRPGTLAYRVNNGVISAL